MDIVSRIKTFMSAEGIGSTQFADACKIPRPTLSQILSGRNKKISDEVISKVHDAYPNLSVLWLLFGEGNMLVNANIKTSEPQNAGFIDFDGVQASYNHEFADPEEHEIAETLFSSEKIGEPLYFDDDATESNMSNTNAEIGANSAAAPQNSNSTLPISVPADGSKSIVNITVFYSDNSFQSFVPR
jgi:transcriptional regulator with XRE-family HTH domain